jgi:hypothetical protein
MLPMRGALMTLATVVAVALAGCKNQGTSTFTNPFLTPDRVPPPSTRVLTPGTAAPYYPGDPLPGVAPQGVAPVVGAPAAGAPVYGPGATLPTTTTLPSSPPLTSPPNGWGAYPPQSSAAPRGDAIGVPRDDQQLRFAGGAVAGTGSDPAALPSAPITSGLAFGPPVGARLPIQSLLPLAADRSAAPQRLQTRELSQSEYLAGIGRTSGATLASAESTRDGFRPQGSQPRVEPEPDDSFRPPEIRREAVEDAARDAAQFGMDPQQEWIRGQLEYWPATGQWSIRYAPTEIPAGAAGRVMIANPQVLANLSPGELVIVQGQAFTATTETGAPQPAYRVAAVQRQRQ